MADIGWSVPGLEEFLRWFGEDEGRYVVIGGVAREMIYREAGLWEESGTKDFDMVLIAEALDSAFVSKFASFVHEGGYRHVTRSGDSQMFRFNSPSDASYPRQVELLSRRPDYLEGIETSVGKVPVENAPYSLSAILLDDEYYGLLARGAAVTRKYGFPTLSHEYLPVFKMKAYLNLKAAREAGEAVHSGEMNKHRRDVFRLCSLFEPGLRVGLSKGIAADVRLFLDEVDLPPHFIKDVGLSAFSVAELKGMISRVYL